MYTLTLTRDERRAIDWVGYRDWNGDDLFDVLISCMDGDEDWELPGEITFILPEHKAWWIADCVSDDGIPHFADSLCSKFYELIDRIV